MWSVLPHVVMEARIACKQQVRGIRQTGYTPSVVSIAAASSRQQTGHVMQTGETAWNPTGVG